ncbi:MAG TPA: hypothetical protein VHF51_02725, partial [Solirubrobacteraceae bacterium]|nr:hypothetical protein [Solirubrobacteraceae bacterium]
MLRDPAYRFAGATIVAGALLGAFALATGRLNIDGVSPALVVLAAFVLAAELVPLRVPMQDDDLRMSASSVFAVSILMLEGTGAALAAYLAGALLRDVLDRLALVKIAFNAANIVLATCAAGLALEAVPAGGMLAALLAGGTLWAMNNG